MSVEMTESENGDNTTRTTIKIDDEIWRRVRSQAIREDRRVSEELEQILREYFDEEEP
ncbi:hypothetical protein C488_02006 [Natrinema pellirubrum DSM 15624]|uniref:Ribbon-helix-helix protein CopG domain-containing protein n=2 Tax=Natrinema pellirubrum TaxID=69525 RepID=L0JJS4_NATP1|nr:hypothetical protein [Natrinema pellirubrum]AGB31093.1 hypothetical protein Natpe_1186 [Natrinema pellirubrum DSM 15624]ELY81065.1 hypothetical protein C488_02006 [Natrinema pellirubrum DSM 15624]